MNNGNSIQLLDPEIAVQIDLSSLKNIIRTTCAEISALKTGERPDYAEFIAALVCIARIRIEELLPANKAYKTIGMSFKKYARIKDNPEAIEYLKKYKLDHFNKLLTKKLRPDNSNETGIGFSYADRGLYFPPESKKSFSKGSILKLNPSKKKDQEKFNNFMPPCTDESEFLATHAAAGSNEKFITLRNRIAEGKPLWHPDDSDRVDLKMRDRESA